MRRPALVLLDVMMPAMDGFAAVHAIKREPGPFVPVILLTALDDPASRAKGIDAGADEVLAKPVHPFELRLRCRAMLRIHHLTEELHAANRRLRALARTDELTDVRNRRGLRSALTREFRRAERYGGALTVMVFDVDRFKQVNDACGHAVGDSVLTAVAQALKRGVREVDVVGRVGGEEFVVLAPETPSRDALLVAERLRRARRRARGDDAARQRGARDGELRRGDAVGRARALARGAARLRRLGALSRQGARPGSLRVADLVLDEQGRMPPPAPVTEKMPATQ